MGPRESLGRMNTSRDFWPALKDRLEKLIESRSANVLAGRLSPEEYRRIAGEISGIKLTIIAGDELASGKQPKAEDKPTT